MDIHLSETVHAARAENGDSAPTVNQRPTTAELRRTAQRAAIRYHLAWALSAVVILVVAASLRIQSSAVELPWSGRRLPALCAWRVMFGIECPGCGVTRSLISLAHGDVRSAWRFNPAGLAVFACVAAQLPFRGMQIWRITHERREWRPPLGTATAIVVGVLLLAQWLVRLTA